MICEDDETLEYMKRAGEITSIAREYAKTLVKVGIPLLEVTEKIETKIKEHGTGMSFPAQISINKIAAHYCCPVDDKTVFTDKDLVKVDLGAHFNGYVGDTAFSVDLTSNGEYTELIKASFEALQNAIKIIQPGIMVSEIGKVINETIESHGYKPIRNLSGHGVGHYSIHDRPSIPNFDSGDSTPLEKGHVIAIEPFATSGAGLVIEQGIAEVFALTNKKPVRNVVVRNILKDIERYRGLPFTTRWLKQKHPLFKVNFALNELEKIGSITRYPPLVEKNQKPVSQAEHTVYVDEKSIVLTK